MAKELAERGLVWVACPLIESKLDFKESWSAHIKKTNKQGPQARLGEDNFLLALPQRLKDPKYHGIQDNFQIFDSSQIHRLF